MADRTCIECKKPIKQNEKTERDVIGNRGSDKAHFHGISWSWKKGETN